MHLQSFKLLCPVVYEKKLLQENTLFDHVQDHAKCKLVPSTPCDLCTCKVCSFGADTITRKVMEGRMGGWTDERFDFSMDLIYMYL